MVNLSDIAAMGGRPIALVDAVWADGEDEASPILEGLRAAASTYGVPIVGGHSNLRTAQAQLAVAVLGRAGRHILTSFDARPGDVVVAAIDHRGAYREPFDNYQAALGAPPERLRGDLALLAEIAEAGLARAAKDISQGGIPGTAAMLAESSGVGIELDLDAIEPPPGVSLDRWLKTFPSFGFLISVTPARLEALLSGFRARNLHAAPIGAVRYGQEVALVSGAQRAVLRDFTREPLMGFGPVESAPESAASRRDAHAFDHSPRRRRPRDEPLRNARIARLRGRAARARCPGRWLLPLSAVPHDRLPRPACAARHIRDGRAARRRLCGMVPPARESGFRSLSRA